MNFEIQSIYLAILPLKRLACTESKIVRVRSNFLFILEIRYVRDIILQAASWLK